MLEHRFFGNSNPYGDLSVQSFRVHTVQQAVADLAYFAENVQLPMPGGDEVAPGKAPWILIGGSYAGALTSYTMHKCVRMAGCGTALLTRMIPARRLSMLGTHPLPWYRLLCTSHVSCSVETDAEWSKKTVLMAAFLGTSGDTSSPFANRCPPTAQQTSGLSSRTSTRFCKRTCLPM